MTRIFAIAFCVLSLQVVGIDRAAAKEPKPLFADDTVIALKIIAPFSDLIRKAPNSTDPYPATLILGGDEAQETHDIMLSARGKSRRDKVNCKFPPLRVEFVQKPDDASLFDDQKRLKLVTHCQSSSRYQQYYVREYAAYKLLNAITPASLKVRMARIDYVREKNGKVLDTKLGFFIEDMDDAAKRNGMKEVDTGDIAIDKLDPTAAATYAVFQYMIGNLDWSMIYAAEDDDCCHNTKLMGETAESRTGLMPVPYDFDYSGLVDAPYAVPPESANVRTVRNRRYRGYCAHNDEALDVATHIHASKATFTELLNAIDTFDDRSRKSVTKYLEDFFEDIVDAETIEEELLARCRG